MVAQNGRVITGWVRNGTVAAARGLVFAVLSQTVTIVLVVASLLAVVFVALGIGVLAVPVVAAGARALADLHRRLARDWSGVDIPRPYRSPSEPVGGVRGAWRRCWWVLTDPATWRDLLWLLVEILLGLVLGLLPFCLIVKGLEGIFVAPFLWLLVDGYGYGAVWPIENPAEALLSTLPGASMLLLGLAVGPWILRLHALIARSLLGPTRAAELHRRVDHLAASRTGVVDARAAELRRIERDLHDGPQARLAALGMNIGLAEELLARDPDEARRLLAEARTVSGEALAELRSLVRGIHPPVLAERGLGPAVQALALALPLPVTLDLDLPGRLEPPLESAAYFCVAEALANVVKHSGAGQAEVRLAHRSGRLTMTVTDDGVGGADPDAGSGLHGVRRRLVAFDGTLAVVSPAGGPTTVTMELPCE